MPNITLLLGRRVEFDAVRINQILVRERQPGNDQSNVAESVLSKIGGPEQGVDGGPGHPGEAGGGEYREMSSPNAHLSSINSGKSGAVALPFPALPAIRTETTKLTCCLISVSQTFVIGF